MENESVINQLEGVQITAIDIMTELFRKGDFSFIVTGENEDGETVTHEKQRQAFEVLMSNLYEEFLYGGAAGGAKTYTGACWVLFMGLMYPGTRYFVARNELKDLEKSVLVTFRDICKRFGFTDYNYNAVKHYITFGNGTVIELIEVKYKPSDPMFEDLGSTEYTAGWIEEVGEIHVTGATVLTSRCGRYKNKEIRLNVTKKNPRGDALLGTVLYTCNPKTNWARTAFYDKDLNGTLEPEKFYLQCLLTENPFAPKGYVKKMRRMADKDKALYERLFKGNWDYEDNPLQLCEQEMIDAVFSNNHVPEGKGYITVDAARFGSDLAVIKVWSGWQVVAMLTFAISSTTEIDAGIMYLRQKYRIPRTRSVADADGVGGGVVDGSRIKPFHNNARPIREGNKIPNYKNLQTQCLYKLAEKINEGGLWYNMDLSEQQKKHIKQELQQIQRKADFEPDKKLECKSKADIKADIGRSPDYRDALLMRVIFDIKKSFAELVTTWN